MLLGISGLAIAASAVFFFKPQNFLFNETPAALADLPAISATKPIAPAIPITPLVTPRLGVIAPNDPAYLVCAGKNALDTAQALIARGPANINETERGVLAAALKSCESLLPRAEPAHSTHLLTMALAAYYALLSEGAERAQDLLTPALLVSDPKLAHETERVLLAQAAISARLGNEEAMYAVLEKAAFVGQALKNLDDDCPLHMPYQSSERYQKLRAKFNSNTALPVKPLMQSAC